MRNNLFNLHLRWTHAGNTCLKLGDKMPNYFIPVQVGGLLMAMQPTVLPPALAPLPVLDASDVVEPPLPPASLKPTVASPPGTQPSAGPPRRLAAAFLLSVAIAMLSGPLLLF